VQISAITEISRPSFEPVPPSAGMSYARGPCDVPLLGETIGENLRRTVARFAEREALVVRHQGYRATYGELWRQVDVAARAFMAHGVRKGDRVGIWAPNRHEWVVTQFATARIGAILVTINPAYKAAEVEYALRKAGVSLLVMARGFRQADYVAMLEEVRGGCPELRAAIVLGDDWDAFLAAGGRVGDGELAEREATLQPADPINIQYTSGTTGFPKGALLSHHNILNNGRFCALQPALHGRGPGVRAGALLPHLRPGDRQPGLRHGRRLRGGAGGGIRSAGDAGGGEGRALHIALRRADDVHRRARRAPLRRLRPDQPAYRRDGRRPLPSRGHEEGAQGHAHARRSPAA
jgi:AMP-binding enzyme